MIVISLLICLFYLLLIGSFIVGFNKVPDLTLNDTPLKTKFSIVIPFRNEAENLPTLLKSISKLNYPTRLFEVIFVDDASEDNSAEILKTLIERQYESIETRVIQNKRISNSPKKDAITTAVTHVKYEWIITTDADCIVPKFWLDSFNVLIQSKNPNCIVAPVTYLQKKAFINRFQTLDMMSLQGATIGGFGLNFPFLCNGANFGYKTSIFKEVKGFEGNDSIASGDDIFLLEKIVKKYPNTVKYLKTDKAIVYTSAQPNWNTLISQRIRWAAKTSNYTNWFGKFTGVIVFVMNFLILALLFVSIFGIFDIKIWTGILIFKMTIDVFLLRKASEFFNQKNALSNFLSCFIIYPFFSVYVAILSFFKGYQWKGRYFTK